MKNMLQNFGSILSILFAIYYTCNLVGFRICLAKGTFTICHPAMACLPHWYYSTVLPYGVTQHNFLQKWCNVTCLCAWASEKSFPGRGH